jgi:DNA-binding NtrC family response regulator
MIIDDESNFADSLQFALVNEFTVSVAGSLKSAREALKMMSPAVILLDLHLQDGDGIEFLLEFKKFTKLPVVNIMAAYSTKESFVKPTNKGAVDYLTKPIDIETLQRELKK